MSIAFVLGNGVSRKEIDLYRLKKHGKIYGCNALYREFIPDVLVATDRPIATAIQESGYAGNNVFYTRRPLENFGAKQVPKQYFGFSSGPIATAIATQDGHQKIYLLGFDMGPVENNRFNNVYAGTEFYKSTESMPTFTGNWVKQLSQVVKDHPSVEFIRIFGTTTAPIVEFEKIPNFKSLSIELFNSQLIP
jgi:hypothetical protein